MFIANKKDIDLHKLDVSLVSVSIIELAFFHPFFLCEMQEFEGENNSKLLTPKLVPNLERLTALAFTQKIANTYLISPGFMNDMEKWSLHRLIKISRAAYYHEDCSSYVYRFELDDGKAIDYDLSGLNENRNELTFVSILNFGEFQN